MPKPRPTKPRRKPRLLELCAGTGSIRKAAEALGFEVMSVDIVDFPGVTLVGDMLLIPLQRFVRFGPDVIWASTPCDAFSPASLGHHWTGGRKAYKPKTSKALLGMALAMRAQEIIRACKPKVWFMENPRGVLRNLDFMQNWGTLVTISYCTYGDTRMKPTDLWYQCPAWRPKPMCTKGMRCHEAAPRGSRTGTQGLKGKVDRAVIPPALCMDVMTAALKQLTMKRAA